MGTFISSINFHQETLSTEPDVSKKKANKEKGNRTEFNFLC